MIKYKKITAIFLLSVFSMLLLHQIIPHSHHQHEVEHHRHDVAHNHKDHHHEHPEKNILKKGFFDWFLDMHVHTSSATDVLLLEQVTVKKITTEKEQVKVLITDNTNLTSLEIVAASFKWYHTPDKVSKEHSRYLSLRAPPSLG